VTDITEADGRIYFMASDGVHGHEPWAHDPATNQTRMIADIYTGFEGSGGITKRTPFIAYQGKVYFSANSKTHGFELYEYQPLTAELRRITDLAQGTISSEPDHFAVYDNKLFFAAHASPVVGQQYNLYSFDAQTDQVNLVVPDAPTSSYGLEPTFLTVHESKLWFWGNSSNAQGGNGLWTYDAATQKTEAFDYPFGTQSITNPNWMETCGGSLFFMKQDNKIYEINETQPGVDLIISNSSNYIRYPTCYESNIYYTTDAKAYRYRVTDGIIDPALDLRPGTDNAFVIVKVGNEILFSSASGPLQFLKRVVQGTSESFTLLPGLGDSMHTARFDMVGNVSKLYFEAERANHELELFSYDVQDNQMRMVANVHQGDHTGVLWFSPFLTPYNGKLYFRGTEADASVYAPNGSDIYAFDPTDATPTPQAMRTWVQGIDSSYFGPSSIYPFDSKLFFSAPYMGNYAPLVSWQTGADSLIVYQMQLNHPDQYYLAQQFTEWQDDLYFTIWGTTGTYADEPSVWKFDKSTQTAQAVSSSIFPRDVQYFSFDTVLLASGLDQAYNRKIYRILPETIYEILMPGLEVYTLSFQAFDHRLFFRPYISNTSQNTFYAYDTRTGAFQALIEPQPLSSHGMFVEHGKLWVTTNDGKFLYVLDPGSDTFRLQADFTTQLVSVHNDVSHGTLQGKLYMHMIGPDGAVLYRLDTLTGLTTMVGDATVWNGNTRGGKFLEYGDKLYFPHTHSFYGTEIWSIKAQCNLTISGTATPSTFQQQTGTVTMQVNAGVEPYAYAWSNGAQTATLTALPPGTYAVTITDAVGCQTNAVYLVDALLQTNPDKPAVQLHVFPNPFHAYLTLSTDAIEPQTLEVRMLDLTGRLLETRNWSIEQPLEISTEHLMEGCYALWLQSRETGQKWVVKLVK
jgi:ELWxxDGT repeat protein